MDGSERPEKRRKLDEIQDASETKGGESPQAPVSQMTLGERKRKGPRVLVNKLNVNHDIIERLRRITKMCGKQMAVEKTQSQTPETAEMSKVGGSNPAENKEGIKNGSCSFKEQKKIPVQEGSTEPSKDSTPTITPIQNGVKHEETALTESGTHKSEKVDNEMKLQTTADVNIFREVLKEVIEQRTKVVEEAVAADSIKLQNRIRELERENRELQWNARKLFNAFRQFLITNEKRKQSKISQGVQVDIDSDLGREVPASPLASVPQTTSIAKRAGLVSTAERLAQTTSVTKPAGLASTAGGMAQTTSVTKPAGLASTAERMAQIPSVKKPAGLVSTAGGVAQTTSVTKPADLVSTAERMAQIRSATRPAGQVSSAGGMAQTTSVTNLDGLVSSAGGVAQTASVTKPAGAGGMAQTMSVTKPAGLVSTARGMLSSGPSITPHPKSLATIVIAGSDPGLPQSFQKSTVQQSSVQSSHSQRNSAEPLTSTAVVYTVKPRLAELTVRQGASSSDVIVRKATYLQTRNERSLETPVSKSFHQPRPLEPRSAASDLPLKAISLSQTDSRLEMIRHKQQTLLQQRERLRQQEQQQQRVPCSSGSPAQHSSETTASLLQQLQRQQQLQQQQQHYHRAVHQEQKSQVRHLSTPPGQASQPEQYRKQSETPISSISAMVQQQRPHTAGVESSSILLQEKQQLIRSPILSTPQQSNHSSNDQGTQGSIYSFVQKQSQTNTPSNPPTSSITFNATHLDNVLNRVERPLMSSAGKGQISVVPSGQSQQSHSTFLKQTSASNQRSHLLNSNSIVKDHINKIVNHPHNGRLGSLGQVTATEMKEIFSAGGKHSATLQRHENATRCSLSSQDVATVQFRKSFPRETFNSRTALATNQRDNSRPPPESLQQQVHVQNPNTQMHPRHEPTGRQLQTTLNNTHSTFVTAEENVSYVEDSQLSKEASMLSTVVASNYRRLEPKRQDKQQNILVPARKKHTNEELLPSGYRFSLPSPEYLLQRQKLQQQSTSQSFQNISSTGKVPVSSRQTAEQTRMVYTMQSSDKGRVITPSQRHFQNASNTLLPSGQRPPLENWQPTSKQQELPVQQTRQTPQLQSRSNQVQRPPQGQQQVSAAPVSNEGGNHRINLQSLYRKPIQSPGISSSDPRSEKHSLDSERTSASLATTINISNDKRDTSKPLPKPSASIAVMDRGIVLSWNMEHDDAVIKIDNYELFACQDVTENKEQPIKWKKIGIVKALPLPMACTLTQFSSGSKYFFSVRAVDEQERAGPFSDPCTVALTPS